MHAQGHHACSFAVCSPMRAMLAQKIKLLAHDNKRRTGCLLNLPAASSRPLAGQIVRRLFQRFRIDVRRRHVQCRSHTGFCRVQGLVMCGISDKALSELRIARAYIKLLCLPEGSSRASVSLASIGSYEIRIFEGRRPIPTACPCSTWNCSTTARMRRSTVAVARRSKTPWSHTRILPRRQAA